MQRGGQQHERSGAAPGGCGQGVFSVRSCPAGPATLSFRACSHGSSLLKSCMPAPKAAISVPHLGDTPSKVAALESSAMRFCLRLTPTLICMALAPTLGHSQKLPPVSRTVFKCQVAGKSVYSDAPCLGAKQINIEPTRGLNQTSGRVQTGADVAREHNREILADAVRPLTGMDAKQLAVAGRRHKLGPEAQSECPRLDADLSAAQLAEKKASSADLKDVQMQLFQLRLRFRDLGC